MRGSATIGIAIPDPIGPQTWSGIPWGLASGFSGHGHHVVPLLAEAPRPVAAALNAGSAVVRRNRYDARYTRASCAARSLYARTRMRLGADLDAVVQIGSEYELPPSTRYAILLDMTLAQAHEVHPDFRRVSSGTFAAWTRRQARIFERAHACCAASGWAADSVVDDFGIERAKVHVVGFGANHRPAALRRDWSGPRFLFVGREWERKNGPTVLRAFAQLRREVPAARLELVGNHPRVDLDGVAGHGTLRLDVPGERARLDALFAAATCFVMPSDCEPFGIAYVEAGAAGIPSIGTTVGGAVDAVGEGGVLVPPRDEAALLDAMGRLSEPTAAQRVGEAAQRHAQRFTWSAVASRVLGALLDPT